MCSVAMARSVLDESLETFKARFVAEMQESESVMGPARERTVDYYAYYRLMRETPEHPYDTDIQLPVLRSGLRTRVGKHLAGFLLAAAPWTVDPAPGVDPDSAEAMQDLLNFQWMDEDSLNGLVLSYRLLKMAELAPTAWAFVGWRTERRLIMPPKMVQDPQTGEMVEVVPAQIEIDRDTPFVELVHPHDAWPYPRVSDETHPDFHMWVREEVRPEVLAERVQTMG